MMVVSVNVGEPREIHTPSGTVLTSIFKSPVQGRVAVRQHNIAGDRQSDLTVHGGPSKAVYAYAEEHYEYWRKQLPESELTPGNFGENLTTRGLSEEEVCIGDTFRFGSAVLQVTQPRMPCYKLGIRFGRPDMPKLFWNSRRSGIYFAVIGEGEVAAGSAIERVASIADGVTVADVLKLYHGDGKNPNLLERALRAPLSGSWKNALRERQSQAE